MRALLLLVLVVTSCTTQRNVATSPTSSPTPAVPTSTATNTPTASPSPIALPSIAQLSAPSGTVVWALVAGTRLFRSSDRGDTWEERSLPSSVANVEVAFADDANGLLLSPGSPAGSCQTQTVTIWGTADGARTWQQVTASGIADPMCKRGLASAAGSPYAFLTAYGPNSGPVIYQTANKGRTWTGSKPLPDPPGFTFTTAGGVVILPARPRVFGATVLVDAQGKAEQNRYVFRSGDVGATFTYASTLPTVGSAVAYVTATRWLQIAPPSSSMETTDGGASWHAYTTDYSQAAPIVPEIVFGDAMVGYATVRGAIQRTTDGGAHWIAIKTPGTG